MHKLALALVALTLFAIRAEAQLANYTFSGGSPRNSSDTDPNSMAGPITDGPMFSTGVDLARGNPAPSLAINSLLIETNTQSGAVTANDYISFTLTPVTGGQFSLTSLSFDYANFTNDGTFPMENFFARSSLDGFSANLAPAVTATQASAGAFMTANIALTDASFQNVMTPVEFRIYFYDGTSDADRGALVDNIILNGVAIPEPGTYALLGLGALVCVLRFRRKS